MHQLHTSVMIRYATYTDTPQVARTLVAAFLDTPEAAWLIPDPVARRQVFQRFCPALIDYGLRQGSVYRTEDYGAVAIWRPCSLILPNPVEYEQLLDDACGEYAYRFRLLDDVLAQRHPVGEHHYLAYLAVTPGRQRLGLGTALLAHRHAILDTAGSAAYVVASSPRARDLYARLGYQMTATVPFHLPDGGPLLWPMWRPAQPTRHYG
ncbi:GNAT family N-acetyltransferase [Solwaraspora sp. WMMD406]|uniref:GNAT family N-acetyltransferase n=1 Tax=Solwaraspora sp. WMMD406 TaxID=3016095 RepID=UPI002417BE8A|nr:GNAT family N-acetyltransferase [Solwaraspora sp. WMMD406]MDG4767356.1 GNAT family N-acetyltransferase [Solwaraspora sp. WMMD406]